jgi:GTPase SAR1 family protein
MPQLLQLPFFENRDLTMASKGPDIPIGIVSNMISFTVLSLMALILQMPFLFVNRDLVMATKGPDTPIVIVGNKSDLVEDRVVSKV